jgi:hypothetical protein
MKLIGAPSTTDRPVARSLALTPAATANHHQYETRPRRPLAAAPPNWSLGVVSIVWPESSLTSRPSRWVVVFCQITGRLSAGGAKTRALDAHGSRCGRVFVANLFRFRSGSSSSGARASCRPVVSSAAGQAASFAGRASGQSGHGATAAALAPLKSSRAAVCDWRNLHKSRSLAADNDHVKTAHKTRRRRHCLFRMARKWCVGGSTEQKLRNKLKQNNMAKLFYHNY